MPPPQRRPSQPLPLPSERSHPNPRRSGQPTSTGNTNTVVRSGRQIRPTERIAATRAEKEEAAAARQKKVQRKEDRHAKQLQRATDLEEEEEALGRNVPRRVGLDRDMVVSRKNAPTLRAPLVPRTNTALTSRSSPPAKNLVSSARGFSISAAPPRRTTEDEEEGGLDTTDIGDQDCDEDDDDDVDLQEDGGGADPPSVGDDDIIDGPPNAVDDDEEVGSPDNHSRKRVTPDGDDGEEAVIAPKRVKRNSSDSSKARLRESDLFPDALAVLKTAQANYRSKICTEWPYPDSAKVIAFAKVAWKDACEAAGTHYEYDAGIAKNIMERGSQVRGELKANSRKFVESLYGITNLQTGPNSRQRVRELVEDLLNQGAFGYKDYSARTGLYQHAAIQALVNNTWFRNGTDNGVACEAMFNPDDKGVPPVTISLVLTAIENALDEWQTGEHSDLDFTEIAYHQKFEDHLVTMHKFEARPGGTEFLLKLRRKLYRLARAYAKVPSDHRAAATVYTEDDFDAALAEGILEEGDDD